MEPPLPPLPKIGTSQHPAIFVARTPLTKSLKELLTDSATTVQQMEKWLLQNLNPETFSDAEVLIGQSELTYIKSPVALECLLLHLKTYGFKFPRLKFDKCSFSNPCFEILCKHLPDLNHLHDLVFDNCNFNIQELEGLFTYLGILSDNGGLVKNLTQLKIRNNFTHFKPEIIDSLALFIQSAENLCILNLERCGLDDKMIAPLVDALNQNNVREFVLDHNSITFKGAQPIAMWAKNNPNVRLCHLVGNNLSKEDQEKLHGLVARKPSPFVFQEYIPVPEPTLPTFDDAMRTIGKASRYSEKEWTLISQFYQQVQRLLFQEWLNIGFQRIECKIPDQKNPGLSFFKAIEMACAKPQWTDCLFSMTMEYIISHIDEFSQTILTDLPIVEGVPLIRGFQEAVYEKDTWAETTFCLAMQKVLMREGVMRPIYIYTHTRTPEITPQGELLPNPSLRFGEGNNPICLHFDGERFALLTKKIQRQR